MSIAEEGRLVARCGICRRRRSLTTFRAVANGERVCGECWCDAFIADIEWNETCRMTLAVMDGAAVPNPHFALYRAMTSAAGYGAT